MNQWSNFEKHLLVGVVVLVGGLVVHLQGLREEAIVESLASLHKKAENGDPIAQVEGRGKLGRGPASLNTINSFSPAVVPQDPFGEAIQLGEKLVSQTKRYAGAYVGNDLSCTNCHLNGGRKAWAAPWVGIWGVFPEYRSRSGKINTLEERINDCFERSLNGRPLPTGSKEMTAILSYMRWLSTEVPTGVPIEGRGFKKLKPTQVPNPENGKRLYATNCASCHGVNGQGQYQADGAVVFPPVWGERSFNIGAGMARLKTAAAFIKQNMPLGREGSLTDEEAFDIAAYFTRQERPDFRKKHLDWPEGGKPEDARY